MKANLLKILSTLFMVSGALILFMWVNSNDPECYYTTGLFLQARFCDKDWVDTSQELKFIYPVTSIVFLIIGVILFKKLNNQNNKDE